MADITVIGLGPGDYGSLTQKTVSILGAASRVFYRTANHPVVPILQEQGLLQRESFDSYYDKYDDFNILYREIATTLVKEAARSSIVYAVPGHPLVAEETVKILIELSKVKGLSVEIIPAMSFLDPLLQVVNYDPIAGLKIVDALQLDRQYPDPSTATVIVQIYNKLIAQETKISLMEAYSDEQTITVVRAAGVEGEQQIVTIPLYELDRVPWLDYLTSVFIPPVQNASVSRSKYSVSSLVEIMQRLRGADGCPWDREQDHNSLKKYLIEETYEVLDAIDEGNMHKVCEELGDLLLQIAFHAQIADEAGFFDINEVVQTISEKLIRRHPHVFGDVIVTGSKEVSQNWEQIKGQECQGKSKKGSILDNVPRGLPALMKAEKVQKKAAKVGFDWPDYEGALVKIYEEIKELEEAVALKDNVAIGEETGDLIFAIVNLTRFFGIDSEEALSNTIKKFCERFKLMETKAAEASLSMDNMTIQELDGLWEEAKKILKGNKTVF